MTFDCAAILFDLDGVLVDSIGSVTRVWKAWAERHALDPEPVIKAAHGRRSIETIRLCAPEMNAEAENKIVERMEIDDTLKLDVIEGARELLESLPSHRWAVVTSGTRALATSRIQAAGLKIPKVLVAADDVVDGKPSPEPYLKGARLLGAAPEDCIVFEDTPAGIKSGHAAGMAVIALTTTYGRDHLTDAEAIVSSLADVTANVSGGMLHVIANGASASLSNEN